jgi:hypothetical protein
MRILLSVLMALSIASAQSKPAGAGHWEGAIQLPDREMKIAVDLVQDAKGEWAGSFAVPEQNVKDAPLGKISVKGAAVAFAIENIPGDPHFAGDLSPDGKTLKGNFMQGGGSLPSELKWVSEGRIIPPAKSTPISKEVEGAWEGTLNAPMGTLRVRFELANGPNGATGTLTSIDQGGAKLPFTTITQKDNSLTLEAKPIGGIYTGELKGGELVGQWTQGPATLPVTLKRPAPPSK